MTNKIFTFEYTALLSYVISIFVFVLIFCFGSYVFELSTEVLTKIVHCYVNLIIFSFIPYTILYIIKSNKCMIMDINLFQEVE